MGFFKSFRLILAYSLALSRGSIWSLLGYLGAISVSDNWYGFCAVIIPNASKVFNISDTLQILIPFVIIGLGAWILRGTKAMRIRFQEEVRARFLSSLIRQMADMPLEVLESPRIQKVLFNVKENFTLVGRILDAPFEIIPLTVGVITYVTIMHHSYPSVVALIIGNAMIASLTAIPFHNKLVRLERELAAPRQEVGTLPAQILTPTNLVGVNQMGDLGWFTDRILEKSEQVLRGERRIRWAIFIHALGGWIFGIVLCAFVYLVLLTHMSLPDLLFTWVRGESVSFTVSKKIMMDLITPLCLFAITAANTSALTKQVAIFAAGSSVVTDLLRVEKYRKPSETADEIGTLEQVTIDRICLDRPGARILNEVSCVIPAGTSLAIVGSNGSGKSSLVKTITGQYIPSSGIIDFQGLVNPKIGFMAQDVVMFPQLTVRENITMGRDIPQEIVARIASFALWDGADLDSVCGSEFGGLAPSGGQRQMIGWARLLAFIDHQRPSIIILDEPTSALDGGKERVFMDHILSLGLTVIFVTHKDSVAKKADQILMLENARVIGFGSPESITTLERYQDLFG